MSTLVRLNEVATITQGLGMSGRAAGSRSGGWTVSVASIGAIPDDHLVLDDREGVALDRNVRTERHLLQADDVLVTARSTVFKVALVPPSVTRTVADSSLLVVRPTLHGLRSTRLEGGDVIAEPQLVDERGRLLAYDRVIAKSALQPQRVGL